MYLIHLSKQTSKNSNWQEAQWCRIMSDNIQVPKLDNKKSLIIIIFCSIVSVFVIRLVLSFQHSRMPITYCMGRGKDLETPLFQMTEKFQFAVGTY